MKRETKRLKTAEDWYPTIRRRIKVSFLPLHTGQWRVCAWGGDDFGLEKDFPAGERQAAKALYDQLIDGTTQAKMKKLGMKRA